MAGKERDQEEMATAFEMYRRSAIGMRLTETLDEMVFSGALAPELAMRVLLQFDEVRLCSFVWALTDRVTGPARYINCDLVKLS